MSEGARIPGNSVVFQFILRWITSSQIFIVKVYIDGPCHSKTLAGVLLSRFERVSHVTFENRSKRNNA